MFTRRMRSRRFRVPRVSMRSFLGLVLLTAPFREAGAQAAAGTAAPHCRAWAFGRLGPAKTSLPDFPIFGSLAGGVAASYGAIVAMVRTTENEKTGFEDNNPPGEHDDAVLGGVRSRGDRLFVVGAAGLAQTVRTATAVASSFGAGTSERRLAPAFDLSAHADYRVAGLSLTVSGVLGPPPVRYVALSFGAELGWFGWR
jgi:hypothetical protein